MLLNSIFYNESPIRALCAGRVLLIRKTGCACLCVPYVCAYLFLYKKDRKAENARLTEKY